MVLKKIKQFYLLYFNHKWKKYRMRYIEQVRM